MSLPSLAHLPVTPTGTGQEDLPAELVAYIQVLVNSDDPCRELVKQCMIDKRWAVPCRDGTIYEATNRRMGWYGTHGSLAAVQQHYRANPNPTWAPPDTAQDYFLETCAALHRVKTQGIWGMPRNPELADITNRLMRWYGAYGSLAAVQQHYLVHPDPSGWTPGATPQAYAQQAYADMLHVHANGMVGQPGTTHWFGNWATAPTTIPRPWFVAMAIVAIQRNAPFAGSETLRYIPLNNPDYVQIALEAVRKSGDWAFNEINTRHPDYTIIAQAACETNPYFLRVVRSVRPDVYYEVARAAVARNGEALEYVEGSLERSAMTLKPTPTGANGPLPSLRVLTPAAYVALAIVAVEQNPDALQWVHPGWPGYERIAIHARRARNVRARVGI